MLLNLIHPFTHWYKTLHTRVQGGSGMKSSHNSMLRTLFVYTLALGMPIFMTKSTLKRLGKGYKLFIVITLRYV